MRDDADPLQLAMLGINPATASLLLNRYVALRSGDWIGQTAANAAVGQYIIALAKRAGVKTLNVVRRHEAVDQVRQWEVTALFSKATPSTRRLKRLSTGRH